AEHNKRFYNLNVDWETNVLVTSGATEALAGALLALINPGDEVVLIEPVYDSYIPMILRAGGVPKTVRLMPPDWTLTREALEAAFSDKTKLILLNSPHNPAARVYSHDELSMIAEMTQNYDTYALCDEVYEHIIFDEHKHIPLMSLPGMMERCIRIGSAGKTFSMTGWKVGYVTAPSHLHTALCKAHQFLTFTTPAMVQYSVASGLGETDAYFDNLASDMRQKRDLLSTGLKNAGFGVLDTQGTYFLSADIRTTGFKGDDVEFCQHITEHAGVTALPMSAFYDGPRCTTSNQQTKPSYFVRFCFCKKESVLEAASAKLTEYFRG
ncbi:MAG: aminotransferase class I/II-fold pyridoxal phosphate-dependent enzyme, partial [Rhodospirillales bacterium]|nr:aminotransferase class I/II-fold pyridoxal phosphate-dependent enzyme [Rhodospirillales bacterium]